MFSLDNRLPEIDRLCAEVGFFLSLTLGVSSSTMFGNGTEPSASFESFADSFIVTNNVRHREARIPCRRGMN